MPTDSPEYIALWNEWLKTEVGRGYEAGWGDHHNRLLAARGLKWVHERMIVARDEQIARLRSALESVERDVSWMDRLWKGGGRAEAIKRTIAGALKPGEQPI